MQTPRGTQKRASKEKHTAEVYDSPTPPKCCQGRLFFLEYGILLGLQLLCIAIDMGIWVLSAYSVYVHPIQKFAFY